MTPQIQRQATQPPLRAIATSKVILVDENASAMAGKLAAAIADLRDRAARERATGSDALAAYMLGRGSRWLKAWLRRAMRQRGEEHGAVEYDFDGR